MIQFGGLVAVANTSLALLAVSILWLDPAPAVAPRRAARDRVPRLPGLPVGAREGRAARVPLPVGPDPPALAGARFGASSPCSTTPARCSGPSGPRSSCTRVSPARTPSGRRASTARRPDGDGPGAVLRRTTRSRARIRNEPHAFFFRPVAVRDRPAGAAPGDGRAAPRRVRADRLAPRRQPADRGDDLQRRRPAPARDARQPGRRRPRERPAGAVPGGAVAAQGAAPLPGLPRPAHRPRRTAASSSSRSTSGSSADAAAGVPGRPVPRPRRLQGRQRHPRPRRRRPAARRGRGPRPGLRPDRRRRRTARRRRVRDPARGRRATSPRRSRSAGRILEALQAPFQIDGQEIAIGGEHRHRRRPRPAATGPTSCSATPTWRCTRPRRPARTATPSSSRRCTPRSSSATRSAPELSKSIGRGELRRLLPADRRRSRPADRTASRRSSAGATRPAASSARTSSSRWPRRTGDPGPRPLGARGGLPPGRPHGAATGAVDTIALLASTCRPRSSSRPTSSTTSQAILARDRLPGRATSSSS